MPDLQARLRQAAAGLGLMRRIMEPAEIVLAGPPNAGKSTLANALVGRPISLVHETAGTTRDWVRELALLASLPVWITDTAGLWPGEPVSRGEGILPARAEGVSPSNVSSSLASVASSSSSSAAAASSARPPEIQPPPPAAESALQTEINLQSSRRALQRIAGADVVLILGAPPAIPPAGLAGRAKVIPIWTKSDLCPPPHGDLLAVSAKTGEGLDALRAAILRAVGLDGFDPAVPRAFTQRQASLLLAAADSYDRGDTEAAVAALSQLLQG